MKSLMFPALIIAPLAVSAIHDGVAAQDLGSFGVKPAIEKSILQGGIPLAGTFATTRSPVTATTFGNTFATTRSPLLGTTLANTLATTRSPVTATTFGNTLATTRSPLLATTFGVRGR